MRTYTIHQDVEEGRALPCDEASPAAAARATVQSNKVCNSRLTSLDNPALEIICAVVRRSLSYRYRNVSPEFVRDAVQEAACRYYEQAELRAEINSRTAYAWILTAAARELGHILRHEGRFVLFPATAEPCRSAARDAAPDLVRDEEFPDGATAGEQLADTITYHMLLENLSHNLAEAVQLHAEGYTADEIAAHVGCTRAAAYKRVQRGCTELRQLWREEEIRVQQMI